MTPAEQASHLVQDVTRLRGQRPAPLNADNQIAYGTVLFKYLPEENVLMVSILIEKNSIWDHFGAKVKENYLKSTAALSDPKIGGMFDTGGGKWAFDPGTGATRLFKQYPLDTPPAEVKRGLDAMIEVAPAWVTRWLGAVADIALGKAPPPTHPVTLADDPYEGQL